MRLSRSLLVASLGALTLCPPCLSRPAWGRQGVATAGTSADAEPVAFWNALIGKPMILRDYAGEADLRYDWDGRDLASAMSRFRSLTAIRPIEIQVDDEGLWLRGTRLLPLRTPDGGLTLDPVDTPVELRVRWKRGTAATTAALRDALFFHSQEEAISALPSPERKLLPPRGDRLDDKHPLSIGQDQRCDVPLGPPKLIRSVDASAPKDLRRAGGSTSVQVLIEINASGAARDLWIARPSAFADAVANAAAAVARFRFRPATCGRDYVPVQLFVEISFTAH